MKRISLPSLLLFVSSVVPGAAWAKLNILTTIPDLRAIAAEIGGEQVTAESIARGTQDPHFIETKPSYMVKASRADLVISIGLDLEVGWLPSVIQGARNPRIRSTEKGYLEVGPRLRPIEVPTGKITRAEGDVHPGGNPHVTLDPERAGEIGEIIAQRLSELDGSHAPFYAKNAANFKKRMKEKTVEWRKRVEKSGVRKAVAYHRTFSYFFDRFGIVNPAILEPKPGIPPTSGHILNVIGIIRQEKIPLVLVENYFDPTVTKKIQAAIPSLHVETVAVSVEGTPEIKTIDDLYENLVRSVERAGGR